MKKIPVTTGDRDMYLRFLFKPFRNFVPSVGRGDDIGANDENH